MNDRHGESHNEKGEPGDEAATNEGSLSSARRAAKETEESAAIVRGGAALAGRDADAWYKEPQDDGTPRSEPLSPKRKPARANASPRRRSVQSRSARSIWRKTWRVAVLDKMAANAQNLRLDY